MRRFGWKLSCAVVLTGFVSLVATPKAWAQG